MRKIGEFRYTSRGCPRFRNLCKVPTYYSARASSFGRDHSQLDNSRKDGGDAHSIKETLKNLSNYMSINTSQKAFYKNNAPVVYLFVLHWLAVQIFMTCAETLYNSLNLFFCDVFSAVVVYKKSRCRLISVLFASICL